MSTIRPLATIAVLAVLGVYLAWEINKGPAVAVEDNWANPAGEDAEEAPAWGNTWTASNPSAAESPTIEAPTKTPALPTPVAVEAPAVPSLPPTLTVTPGTPPNATNEPLDLPDNIPQASYAGTPRGITGSVPSLGTSTGNVAAPKPLAPSTPPGFAAAWEAVQAALAQDQLPQAHRMLSRWRGEEGLSPTQQQEVEGLLGQLAGSVVYSAEHRLEPPHAVVAGETLATIAQQYNVPWQLLAKINGVASAEAVQPGQVLKVIRGPFAAEIDLQQGEITLLLGDRYAGKFPVRVEGAAPGTGAWRVGQKKLESVPPVGNGVVTASVNMEQKVVLENPTGQLLELSSGSAPGTRGRLTVASGDLSDLYDILSVGSHVTIVR